MPFAGVLQIKFLNTHARVYCVILRHTTSFLIHDRLRVLEDVLIIRLARLEMRLDARAI